MQHAGRTELPADRYADRELSWLDYAERILELAEDDRVAAPERIRYVVLLSEGLDEFYQVRVAGLEEQLASGMRPAGADGRGLTGRLEEIGSRVASIAARQAAVYSALVAGRTVVGWGQCSDAERSALARVFNRRIFPVLTPLVVDAAHPFPYVSNLSLNLLVVVREPDGGTRRFARIKVPPVLDRLVRAGDRDVAVPLEEVIAAHLGTLFPGMAVEACHRFRVTRNADLSVEEYEERDALSAVQEELKRRRLGRVVRLEVEAGVPDDHLDVLARAMAVPGRSIIRVDGLLDLTALAPLMAAPPPPSPAAGPFADRDPFTVLAAGEVLVHHPYDAYGASVGTFLEAAATDPDVLAVKQILYRTSGDAPVADTLVAAARSGKQVTAVVEITALFDEQANIERARALDREGAHVSYGIIGRKTHAKATLVVRQEDGVPRRYCHVGTGNYNPATALTTEDVGILSADPELTGDVANLFNHLTGQGSPAPFRRLVVAPWDLRRRLLEEIDAEAAAGKGGRIVVKVSGITDPGIIDALYRASMAGATVEVVVRSWCCIRPGVPGLSERVRVRSVVGPVLEHSRIFRFGGGSRPARTFVGSADLMERNLDRRVEALVEVVEAAGRARLDQVIAALLGPDVNAWELDASGRWSRVGPSGIREGSRHRQPDEWRPDGGGASVPVGERGPGGSGPPPGGPPTGSAGRRRPDRPAWWRRWAGRLVRVAQWVARRPGTAPGR